MKIVLKYLQIGFLALMAFSAYRMSGISETHVVGLSFDDPTERMIGLALAVILCVVAVRKWMSPPVNAVDIVLAIFFGLLIFPKLFTFLWFIEIKLGNYWSNVIAYGLAFIIVCKGVVPYMGISQKILLIVSVVVMVINFTVHKFLMKNSFWEMSRETIEKISIYVQLNGVLFFAAAVLAAIAVVNLIEDKLLPPAQEKQSA